MYVDSKRAWNKEERTNLSNTLVRRTAASMIVLAAMHVVGPPSHCLLRSALLAVCEAQPAYVHHEDLPEPLHDRSPWRGAGMGMSTSSTVTSSTSSAFRLP